LEYSKF